MEFIRQMVGSHYSDDGARQDVIMNIMELAVNIYSRQLVAQRP